MKKIFISVAMNGREKSDIIEDIKKLIDLGKAYFDDEVQFIDNMGIERIFPEGVNERAWYLGEAIKKLAACDAMITFDNEMTNRAKGCQVEREVCYNYGIPVLRIEDWCFRERLRQNIEEVPVCEG